MNVQAVQSKHSYVNKLNITLHKFGMSRNSWRTLNMRKKKFFFNLVKLSRVKKISLCLIPPCLALSHVYLASECVENKDRRPKTLWSKRRPTRLRRSLCGLKVKRRLTGLKRSPSGLKRRPAGPKRRPCGLKQRFTGLKPFCFTGTDYTLS